LRAEEEGGSEKNIRPLELETAFPDRNSFAVSPFEIQEVTYKCDVRHSGVVSFTDIEYVLSYVQIFSSVLCSHSPSVLVLSTG
jgi:hypothetical protein